ncbi:MAG: hypothetical protein RQ723_09380, partial [Desulfuromonadales bacterium]|nr:hypothetical protein [Desulfuromonadales bacterium]
GMDGLTTLHRLRQINPAVKIILSSGFGEEAATAALVDNSTTLFLQKPYKLEELYRQLCTIASSCEATPVPN